MNYKKLSKIKDSAPLITEELVNELNSLLAEEFQAWYQYYAAAPFLFGKERPSVQEFFIDTAKDELDDHATKLINRLSDLQVNCKLIIPEDWAKFAQAPFEVASNEVVPQLEINIKAEERAIEHYQRVIELAESLNDFVTADILKKIQADEQEHLAELLNFKQDI